MTYEAITTHPDGTWTIDLDGKTYRAEIDKVGTCIGCAFGERSSDCLRAVCSPASINWPDGLPDSWPIIWVLQQ